jgi:exosortase
MQLPGRLWFGLLLILWIGLFHLLGNSTLGYVNTPSLFGWMKYAYDKGYDDQLGYLVPFIVLVLMWWKRQELLAVEKRIWWPAAIIVVIGLCLHILGFLIQQTRVSVVGFFIGLYGLMGVAWGPLWLRATFFPYFLFVFSVPLGNTAERITFPLRMLATQLSVGISHGLLGINVLQQGTALWAPSGKFRYEIAAACSGIRSLTLFVLFTTVLGFVYLNAPWRRLTIIASAFPLAVFSNVVRLLCIIVAAEAFGQEAGTRLHDSSWFSPLPYVPSLLAVVALSKWLEEKPKTAANLQPPRSAPGPATPIPALGFPTSRQAWTVLTTVVLMIGLSGQFLVFKRANQRLGQPGVKVVPETVYGCEDSGSNTNGSFPISDHGVYLPATVLDYTSTNLPIARTVFEWLPRDTVYGQRLYRAPDGLSLLNNVVLMGADRTSIHQPQYCLPAGGFAITKTEKDTLRILRPQPYDLPVAKLTAKGTAKLANGQTDPTVAIYVYWFVADNQLTADHVQRMWWMSRDLVSTGVLQRWAYVSYLSYCYPGSEDALYARMKDFIIASIPEFQLAVGSPAK